MKEQIELNITVRAGTAEVWYALTDADELENWWGEGIKLEARVGGQFREKWEDDDGQAQMAAGKVLDVKKSKLIRFTWVEKSWPKSAVTECTYEISEAGPGKSILTVRHTGWETLPAAIRAKTLKDFKTGWTYHLKELKEYLDF